MARVLIAGGLYPEDVDKERHDELSNFATALGRELILSGHIVMGGCRTELDAIVAKSAAATAREKNLDPRKLVRSWVSRSTTPIHSEGEVTRSSVEDWSHVPKGYAYPEPIRESDVVIIVGGWEGTHYAASWARLARKPLVPVASFGLAAAEIFSDEMAAFEQRYGTRLTADEYQILNRILNSSEPSAILDFARDVAALSQKLVISKDVFVIMSFADKGHLKDAYNTFHRVCGDVGFTAFKIDHHFDANQRIVPNIIRSIRRSAFIIADVSDPKPNVYYELGYAQALGKDVILTAAEGTQIPFDIFDVPTLFWDCQDTLERKLGEAIRQVLR